MIRIVLVVGLVAALAAFVTRPTEAEIRDKARTLMQDSIERNELDDVADPALALVVAGCKADARGCAEVLSRATRIDHTDRRLYARIDAQGFGRKATCYAAFTRLFCPGGLVK
ncbi:hypothetical protein [Salibaculum sp.]|uniref:hypothetical protein n=1 Tax=Salibaculum sp. TaxID=2855480 RepID=UPI002B47E3F9|nr:hypothetical protein [Salibaculum sp.]HKL69992.1 hypothetical protein [Salibaculum sp.]